MMKVDIPAGKYIVAVSGGVDSIVLLDLLSKKPDLKLIVAHFNHGIRKDSGLDEKLVYKAAQKNNLPYVVGYGRLGPTTSEEKARKARYSFLEKLRQKQKAKAIITAHHQDDLLETAFINILRGTGRRGLTALARNPKVKRPLLAYSKQQLVEYAKKNSLKWREDPTNRDLKYLRNYVRAKIVPRLTDIQRFDLANDLTRLAQTNETIDSEVETISSFIEEKKGLNRRKIIELPPEISGEVIMHWLRQNNIKQFDKKAIDRLNVVIMTGKAGTSHEVIKNKKLRLTKTHAFLD